MRKKAASRRLRHITGSKDSDFHSVFLSQKRGLPDRALPRGSGPSRSDLTPRDVDQEFVTAFFIFNEDRPSRAALSASIPLLPASAERLCASRSAGCRRVRMLSPAIAKNSEVIPPGPIISKRSTRFGYLAA